MRGMKYGNILACAVALSFAALAAIIAVMSSGCAPDDSNNSSNLIDSDVMKTGDIFNLDHREDMAVTFYYDTEEPDIIFIAPNGDEIASDDLESDRKDNAVCYYVDDAMPGQWSIRYDKKGNTTLDVNWAPRSSGTPDA